MGTSEEIRSDHHQQQRQQLHAQYPHGQHRHQFHDFSPLTGPQAFVSSPVSTPGGGQWPHEKLSELDVAHAAHAMEIDPTHDNQHDDHKSPSPTHFAGDDANNANISNNANNANANANIFQFGEPSNNQQSYGGLVATPITRFLTKQNFGFIPKPSFPPPSDGVVLPPRSAPSSPSLTSGTGKIPSLRLPSLSSTNGNGSLPQSPLASPQGSFSLPVGETLSRLFGSASLHNGSAPGTPTSGGASPQLQRTSSFTLPPLKRACLSPTTTTLPPLAQQLSLDDIGRPFRYQRSMSCPSDAMARGAAVARAMLEHEYDQEMEREAYAAPHVVLQHSDVPKLRVERSNSVDVTTVLSMRDAHHRALYGGGEPTPPHDSPLDFHNWLDRSHTDRHPLASLAESAHAMQRLEQRRPTGQGSPRSVSSDNENGSDDEALNPFDASDSSDLRREKKVCAFPRCASNAVTRGLCISHGGGRRCQRKGCTRGAQSKGLCVAHGGGRICKAKGCSNIQRSMGLCIRHGGGKRCSVQGCQKGVVRQDLCTAHGGKRKCKIEDCNKHVKKKGLCRSHANAVLGNAAAAASSAISSPRGDALSPEYSS